MSKTTSSWTADEEPGGSEHLLKRIRDELGAARRRADGETEAAVRRALGRDHSLDAADIDVECRNQVVTLRGRVELPEQRGRAGQLALYVPGVWRVRNRLVVTSSDAG